MVTVPGEEEVNREVATVPIFPEQLDITKVIVPVDALFMPVLLRQFNAQLFK